MEFAWRNPFCKPGPSLPELSAGVPHPSTWQSAKREGAENFKCRTGGRGEAQAAAWLQGLLSEGLWDAQRLCKNKPLASEDLFAWHGIKCSEEIHKEQGVFTFPEHHVSVTRLFPVTKLISHGLTQMSLHRTAVWHAHAHTLCIFSFPDKNRCNNLIPTFMKWFVLYIWKAFHMYLSVIVSNLIGIQKAAYFFLVIFLRLLWQWSSRLQYVLIFSVTPWMIWKAVNNISLLNIYFYANIS